MGWFACQIELATAQSTHSRPDDGWRRTTKGWERLVVLRKSAAPPGAVPLWQLHPHPFVTTLLLVMLSVLLLVASAGGAIFPSDLSLRPAAKRTDNGA
ncbi:MAG: hypothetical protein IT427_12095 [Pirellulales bacterium]|nr:hypothetical protein [Pirellulales bacterium]